MSMSMDARRQVSEVMQKRYAKSLKNEKGVILDNVVEMTGWCRKHAAAVLRGALPIPKSQRRKGSIAEKRGRDARGRKPKYSTRHKEVLLKVWATLDFCSSRRLKAGMADALESMERFRHMVLEPAMRADMLSLSASTMDKLLAFNRKSMQLKGRSTTKPGSLLKSQIPIRRGSDWTEDELGFTECDTVAHCGHSAAGEFCFTLDMTDVKSGWTLLRAVRNKARIHTVKAIDYLRAYFPFALKGIDSDNGSEFINHHLATYCNCEHIVFTRGRPNTKNDGCFVEQKNWSVARRFVGYIRLEGQDAADKLNELYGFVNIFVNFFMPSQKLVLVTRDGACVSRKHDKGLTPYRRVMMDISVPKDVKDKLRETFESLDVVGLKLKIARVQGELKKMAVAE